MATIVAAAGGGNWTTGGTWVGGIAPTANDDAQLTAASGNVTIDNGAVCQTADFTGYLGTANIATNATWTIGSSTAGGLTLVGSGSFTANSGSTVTFTGGSGATYNITTAGRSLVNITINSNTTTIVKLLDAFTCTGTVTLTQGALDTNGKAVSASILQVNGSSTRTLTMGASAITLSSNSSALNANSVSGLTVTANTATMTLTGGSGATFNSAANNWNGLSVVFSGSGTHSINGGAITVANLTRTGTAVKTDSFSLFVNVTVTSTFTATGNSTTNRVLVQSSTLGTTRTVTAAVVSLTNVDFQDITGAGVAAPFTGTSLGDALGNTSITFDVAVTRYAVVAGNWSSTATWSATDGGAGGVSVPLSQDTVILNANSAAGTYTADMPRLGKDITMTGFTRTLSFASTTNTLFGNVTLASGATYSGTQLLILSGRGAQTLTSATKTFPQTVIFAAPGGTYTLQDAFATSNQLSNQAGTLDTGGFSVTALTWNTTGGLTQTRAVTLSTSAVTLSGTAGAVFTASATGFTFSFTTAIISFTGTSGTPTITTGGVTMPNVTFNGVGGTWQFADAFTTSGTITLTNGTLDTNSKAVSSDSYASTANNTRTLTLGSTAWTVTGTGTPWNQSATTGMTFTANTAVITVSGAGSQMTWSTSTINGTSVVFSGSGTQTLNVGTVTFANVTRTGTASKTDAFTHTGGITVTGTYTITGNSLTNRVLVQSSVVAATRTITAAIVALTNVDFMDITGAGAASPFTGTSLGDALGNSDITFDSPVTQTHTTSAGGSWSDNTKWTSRVPLPQDNVIVNANTSGTLTADMPRWGANMTFTGFTGTVTNSTAAAFFGSLTLGTGMTLTANASATYTASGRSSLTITSNGVSIPGGGNGLFITAPSGTYTLQDTATWAANFQLNNGTFNTNNFNWQCNLISDSGSATRALTLGTSTVTLIRTSSGSVFGITASGMTFSGASSTIVIGNASTATRTFAGATQTYGTLTYTVASSSGSFNITNANNVFNTITVGAGRGLVLPSATTTTVTNFNVNGTLGNPTYLTASAAASAATLSVASGTVTGNYLIIKDSTATGGATFKAVNSQSISNVSGWTFSYARTAVPASTPRMPANSLYLPKVSGNYASCPDSAVAITGDLDLRGYLAPNSWTPASEGNVVAQYLFAVANSAYDFSILTAGTLRLHFSITGSASVVATSTAATGFSPGSAHWVRLTRNATTGDIIFYTSSDGVTWTKLGNTVNATAGALFDSTRNIEVGGDSNGTGDLLAGNFYKVDIRNNILDDGTGIVANPDFTSATTSGFTDSVGNVWTINASGIIPAQLVGRQ